MKRIILFSVLFMLAFSLQAGDFLGFRLGGYGEAPLDVSNGLSFGFFGEVRFGKNVGIMLDLEYRKGFYSYEDGAWLGPMHWNQVNHGSISRGDWIFYQWDCLSSLYLNLYLPIPSSRFTLGVGVAPSMHFVLEAPSVDNYPEFEEFYQANRQEVINTLGLQVRAVAEYTPFSLFPYVFLGGGAKLKIHQLKTFEDEVAAAGWDVYLANNIDLFFYLSIGL